MINFKKLILKKILLLTIFFTFSAVANVSLPADTSPTDNSKTYLFIQSASNAVLTPIKNQQNRYTLQLSDVQPYVIYFTDRPNRITGLLDINNFLKGWHEKFADNFQEDAPNVGVNAIKLHSFLNKQDVNIVLVLANPVYNSSKKTPTYTVKITYKKNLQALPTKPVKFANISLFFDNLGFCPQCCCN